MQGDPPRSQRSQQVVQCRKVEVVRVVVGTAPVDRDYARVELVINGLTYEMDRPAAQALGDSLYRAAGGSRDHA